MVILRAPKKPSVIDGIRQPMSGPTGVSRAAFPDPNDCYWKTMSQLEQKHSARYPAMTPTTMHWGRYSVRADENRVVAIESTGDDPYPSPIGPGMVQSQNAVNRITAPMVRRSWLENGPASGDNKRGHESFVEVAWDEAFDLAANELERVRSVYGNESIYGGSYGWASAGRFHHAQSQIHRFLRTIGGYTDSVNSYSAAAMEVILPHVIGGGPHSIIERGPQWPEITEHGELVVSFGGLAARNAQVVPGGVGRHEQVEWQRRAHEKGVEFVNVSPWKNDAHSALEAAWLPLRPNTDVALMLGLAWVLIHEDLHDRDFLDRCCIGFSQFEVYVTGELDGRPKTPAWAAKICGIEESSIWDLGRKIGTKRTTINVAWAVQRQHHGEQPEWMGVVLSAMSGSMGKPGGGPSSGLGVSQFGVRRSRPRVAALPQGTNQVKAFIPVARITDMLLNPGAKVEYNGRTLTYPDIRLVYWAGGNPFHHHQDLNRFRKAWQRPETIISHDSWWNPLTKHSDIVFPVATVLERDDFAIGQNDLTLSSIAAAVPPPAGVRSDYAVFCALASRLGKLNEFSEGRDDGQWVRHLYDETVEMLAKEGVEICDLAEFRKRGFIELPANDQTSPDSFATLRADPYANALSTPSGRVEIFSDTIAGFGYEDCPGHPVWMEPDEWLGSDLVKVFPLHLISPQPKTRLHSQHDGGGYSQESKIHDREPVTMNPTDMAARGISEGDAVEIFNTRGRTLAGAVADDGLLPGVIALATGAWFDPDHRDGSDGIERHGNPNVLTLDRPTSKLAQAPSAGTTLVEVQPFTGELPRVEAFDPPTIELRH